MAEHPDRVARAAFLSPGALWRPGLGDGSADPVRSSACFFRPLMGQVIAGDLAACGEDRGAADADSTGRETAGESEPPSRPGVPAGFGFYAMMVTNRSLGRVDDPRESFRQVDTPVKERTNVRAHREDRGRFRQAG